MQTNALRFNINTHSRFWFSGKYNPPRIVFPREPKTSGCVFTGYSDNKGKHKKEIKLSDKDSGTGKCTQLDPYSPPRAT